MKWKKGRQGSGYFKRLLLKGKTWDLYLLKYPAGSHIETHLDPVEGKEHHRINIVLKKSKGGFFFKDDGSTRVMFLLNRIVRFRPDIEAHGVTTVISGTRYVLSFGWVK